MSLDTSATYLGLRLKSPIVIGGCGMTMKPETVRELVNAGAGAIVLPSLFEEQVVHELMERGEKTSPQESLVESLAFEPADERYNGGPKSYLESIKTISSISGIPVIASLNGCTDGKWLSIALEMERAGASAMEVTLEMEQTDPTLSADKVEESLIECITELADQIRIPISVKLTSYHTNLPNLAWRLTEAGASGLVCFAHEPSWHVEIDRIAATLNWALTSVGTINPTLAGLARVRSGGPSISLAASGGICTSEDVIKALLIGADVVMLVSQIYRFGPDIVAQLLDGLTCYLEQNGFQSLDALIAARPAPIRYRRSAFLRSITKPERTQDPTPQVSNQVGDRWGHPT